jgi:hypothetical protein
MPQVSRSSVAIFIEANEARVVGEARYLAGANLAGAQTSACIELSA